MPEGEAALALVAHDVSAGKRPIKAFYAAFAKAVVFAQRPEKPGVFVTDLARRGRWTVVFSTLERLAAHAGECEYVSMPGAVFLELVPPGVGVVVDPEDEHRLPLLPRVDDFFALEREWKRTAPARPEFGIREFQLQLCALMPETEVVDSGLAWLGATRDEAGSALEQAESLGFFDVRHKIDLERSILGEPAELGCVSESEGTSEFFHDSRVLAFALPLFEGFDYLVNVNSHGFTWGNRFGRRGDSSTPIIESVEDMRPWRFVLDEVLDVLKDPRLEDEFNAYQNYSGRIFDARRRRDVEVVVRFDYELLQSVTLLE